MLEIKHANHWPDRTSWNLQLREKYSSKFREVFGIEITRFMHPYWGFDIFAFDTWIGPIDGRSCAELTKEQYGQEGLDIINGLLESAPKPDPVPTWADIEFDIEAAASTKGFVRCRYSFFNDKGGLLAGKGYYKDGLIVHRPHYQYEPFEQMDFNWSISTMQGVKGCTCSGLDEAKIRASQMAKAIDFTKAQTLNLTPEQWQAVKRVGEHWRC